MLQGLASHARRNVVAYLALVAALGAATARITAVAARSSPQRAMTSIPGAEETVRARMPPAR